MTDDLDYRKGKVCILVTSETVEANDAANGKLRIYKPEECHTEAKVGGDERVPPGVWITGGGWYKTIHDETPGQEEYSVGVNKCYCPFCKGLRAASKHWTQRGERQ
jgi:hypothetical protein